MTLRVKSSENCTIIMVLMLITIIVIAVAFWSKKSDSINENNYLIIKYQEKILELLEKNESLRDSVEIKWINIDNIIVQRDTLWMELELMAPEEVLAEFDKSTGDHQESSILNGMALVEMPRIKESVRIFIDYDAKIKENITLREIVNLQEDQIKTLMDIVSDKDAIIDLQDENIKDLMSKLGIEVKARYITAAALLFLILLL